MRREKIIWTVLLVVAGVWIVYRTASGQMGRVYSVERDGQVLVAATHAPGASFDWTRTIGLWAAALFTLCVYSFLYRDNIFYRFAEAVVVGVSAAYWMVTAFWNVIIPNVIGKIAPALVQSWAMPGLKERPNYWYLIPLLLGILLLWRLMPKGGWISRWPLAFIIGTTAGIRLVGFLEADFLNQIRNTIRPLFVRADGGFDLSSSLANLTIVVGVLSGLVYFFFSIEHKGLVGRISRLGIWFLMITFGAGFGYTVMGRIALLAIRLEFLFDDWLWIIDPQLHRSVAATVGG
jgi:hypothetical protein